MMKHKKLAIMVVLIFWVAAAQRLSAGEYMCTSSGVIGQDNFSPVLQGHYCSTAQNDSQAVCGTQTDVTQYCSGHCGVCGGTYVSGMCTWQASGSPGDSAAQTWGCTSTQYMQYYKLDCTCNYPPSCYPDGSGCGSDTQCCSGFCDPFSGVCGSGTPILINLENNSSNFQLTSAADGVLFDINSDGILEQIAWTQPDSLVAFLVLDRNHNGTIDDGSELFGTATRKSDGTVAANGFDALLDLDGGPLISDGKIDASDAAYWQLRLWLDRNHDGISQPDELITLPQARISAIFTDYRESRRVDQYGNAYRFMGKALMANKNGKDVPILIFDVVFSVAG